MKVRNNRDRKVAVIVPIYRKKLTRYETFSLQQCLQVFHSHPIALIAPDEWRSLGREWVVDVLKQLPSHDLEFSNNLVVEYFPAECFQSVNSYNRLLLSKDFYLRFENFEFILIYQLDAFVFSDQLMKWCEQGFDYIGAPWFGVDWIQEPILRKGEFHRWKRRFLRRFFSDPIYMVGNGGFSLRKTRAFLNWLNLFHNQAREWEFHEDTFWGIFIRANFPFVRFPKINQALEFSFEVQPRDCYAMNNNQLPFGCHAWWTYDLEFWQPWIEKFGYQINPEECSEPFN